METIISWTKENFDLICLFVGMAGVLISIVSVIYEVKAKRRGKQRIKQKWHDVILAIRSFICIFEGKMRRVLMMIRLFAALCVMCLAVLLNWPNNSAVSLEQPCLHRESSVVVPQHRHHQEATLTDVSQIYRICTSRPQRILPARGSKTERTITPFGNFAIRQHNVKPLYSFFDSRCRMETAPFCLSASCDYYVIALRRIIR